MQRLSWNSRFLLNEKLKVIKEQNAKSTKELDFKLILIARNEGIIMNRSAVVLSFDFAVILEFLVVQVHINFAGRHFPRYIVGSPYDESTVRIASTDQVEI